jgi:hypothetical protein
MSFAVSLAIRDVLIDYNRLGYYQVLQLWLNESEELGVAAKLEVLKIILKHIQTHILTSKRKQLHNILWPRSIIY